MNNLQSIVSHFNTKGTVNEIQPLGSGLINDTYKVTTLEADAPDYVLQRINHAIFQNVEMLQTNIEAVTRHIRKKLTEQGADDIDRKVLSFIPADTGKMPVLLLAISRRCLRIFRIRWERRFLTSIIWSFV